MAAKDRNIWILIVFLLSGLVIGGLLRRICKTSRFLMVASIWSRIWPYEPSYTRPKRNCINLWDDIQNKHSKHNRNGSCNIYL